MRRTWKAGIAVGGTALLTELTLRLADHSWTFDAASVAIVYGCMFTVYYVRGAVSECRKKSVKRV